MERLTAKRVNGIKSGYWSPAKKDELVQRLGKYEDTGMEPEELQKTKEGQKRCRQARQKKQISEEIKQAVLRQAEQQLNDGRVEAILVCMTLVLHQEFGFGRERCLRALRAVDQMVRPWIEGEENLDGIRQKVIDQVGIDIKC